MTATGLLPLLREAFSGHDGWPPLWRPGPRRAHHDVIVVGGDAFALLTAWALAAEGEAGAVALLTGGALGTGGAGPDVPLHGLYGDSRLCALAGQGLERWRGLADDLGYDLGLEDLRHLVVARSAEGRRAAGRTLQAAQSAGLTVRPGPDAGAPVEDVVALQEAAAAVQSTSLLFGLARAAAGRGVDLIERRPARGLKIDAGLIAGVETAQGLLKARRVVLCGAEGAALAGVGAPVLHAPQRVMVSEPLTPVLEAALHWPEQDVLVTQAARGEIVLRGGGSAEDLARRAVVLMPRLARLRVTRWQQIDRLTGADGAPLVGALDTTGLFAGFADGAEALWPVLAGHLVDHLLGRADAAAAVLAGERFAAGRPLGPVRLGGAP